MNSKTNEVLKSYSQLNEMFVTVGNDRQICLGSGLIMFFQRIKLTRPLGQAL